MAQLSVILSGFLFSLSLIVVIGAQNTFVLRQGLLGRHVPLVVGICLFSDAVLMALGIAGVGLALQRAPGLLVGLTLAGSVFLATYGFMAFKRVLYPQPFEMADHDVRTSMLVTAATCIALTWLNPHVYLDTVVLLGSVANTNQDGRWAFGAGAVAASATWFTSLGFGARWLRPWFKRPIAWRVLDALIAVVMITMAITLLVQL